MVGSEGECTIGDSCGDIIDSVSLFRLGVLVCVGVMGLGGCVWVIDIENDFVFDFDFCFLVYPSKIHLNGEYWWCSSYTPHLKTCRALVLLENFRRF